VKELKEFLKALQKVKSLKDDEGLPYDCFGAYNDRNETCIEQYNSICIVCRKLHTIPTGDWIEEELTREEIRRE